MHEYTEAIQRWEDQFKAGEFVRCGGAELEKSLIVTLARKLKGYPPIAWDTLGPRAKELIDA